MSNGASVDSPVSHMRHAENVHRLWMLNHYAVGPDMPGGNRHFELSRELLDHGWNTTVFATPFSHRIAKPIRDVSLFRPFYSETIEDVAFRWIYSSPYKKNDWRRYLNMLSFAAASIPGSIGQVRPDVVLGSSPHPIAAFAAWLLAKRHRAPFVFEVRDLWPDTLIQMGLKNPAVIKPLAALERFLYQQAALIPVLTEGIGESIEAKGVPAEKVLFLPNASKRPEPIEPESRQATRRRMNWQDSIVAIYAGAHGPANGLEEVIDATSSLQGQARLKLVFLGDGPSKDDLQRKAAGRSDIEFLDPVPKNEVSSLLRAADIGILSLRNTKVFEGARPNKIFDYMANGLPVLTTIGGEAARVLEEAQAGDYVPFSELAHALKRLARDESRRKTMGQSGFQYVSSTMTREQTASILADRLDQLLVERNA